MTVFEMDAIQLILEILDWSKSQFVAKDRNYYW